MPYYWLIVKYTHGQMEILTRSLASGGAVLPVFSSEEDARAFLPSRGGDDWWVRKTGAGELISVLFGPCRGCKLVALDPPQGIETEAALELVSVGRESFMEPILGRGKSWFEVRGADTSGF